MGFKDRKPDVQYSIATLLYTLKERIESGEKHTRDEETIARSIMVVCQCVGRNPFRGQRGNEVVRALVNSDWGRERADRETAKNTNRRRNAHINNYQHFDKFVRDHKEKLIVYMRDHGAADVAHMNKQIALIDSAYKGKDIVEILKTKESMVKFEKELAA